MAARELSRTRVHTSFSEFVLSLVIPLSTPPGQAAYLQQLQIALSFTYLLGKRPQWLRGCGDIGDPILRLPSLTLLPTLWPTPSSPIYTTSLVLRHLYFLPQALTATQFNRVRSKFACFSELWLRLPSIDSATRLYA